MIPFGVGKFYYSQKQLETIEFFEPNHRQTYAKLNSGEIVPYTEMVGIKHLHLTCNWDDAVFLGFGIYHHSE
jgi:hypothetical protein